MTRIHIYMPIAETLNPITGDTIMSQEPYTYAFDPNITTLCCRCKILGIATRRCSACKIARYCSVACQKADWLSHKQECSVFARYIPSRDRTLDILAMRLVLRIIRAYGIEPTSVQGNQDTYEDVLSMHKIEHYWNEGSGEAAQKWVANLAQALPTPFPMNGTEGITDVLYRTLRNSFAIPDAHNVSIGRGVFPSASYFNHSCEPNAWAYFNLDCSITIRAIRPISPGDEITISYTDGTHGGMMALYRQFFFRCQCIRCAAQSDPSNSEVLSFAECTICTMLDSTLDELTELHHIALDSHHSHSVAASALARIKHISILSELDPPSSIGHDMEHYVKRERVKLDALMLMARYEEAATVASRLSTLYADVFKIPPHVPTCFQNELLLGSLNLRLCRWKEAAIHLRNAVSGFLFSKNHTRQETELLLQLAENPSEFQAIFERLQILPYLHPDTNELVIWMLDGPLSASNYQKYITT